MCVYALNTLQTGDNLRITNHPITWTAKDGRQESLMSMFACQLHAGAIVILINEESWLLHTVHNAIFFFLKRHQKEQLSVLSWLIDVFGHEIHSQEWKLLQISELYLSSHLRVYCCLSTATFFFLFYFFSFLSPVYFHLPSMHCVPVKGQSPMFSLPKMSPRAPFSSFPATSFFIDSSI